MSKKIDSKKLRNVAGGFATGITVACIEQANGEVKGLTANSFVSISLDPPIVLISVANDASFMQECSVGKPVGISILSDQQKEISNQFAGMNEDEIPVTFISNDRCHCIHGSLAWYETTIRDIIPAGDHHLILCDVHDLGREESAQPILYYSGYHILGDKV